MPQTEFQEVMEEDTLKGKYLIFYLGKELYGLEICYVTEIIGIQPITALPNMPNHIKGVINLRGKIIPVMDVRLLLKKEIRDYDDRTCIIVLDINDVSIGLIVDSVSEVINIADNDITYALDMNKDGINYVKGIAKANGDIKLILDCQKILFE